RQIFGYARHEWIGRAAGTYINPNHFAGLLELALPAALGLGFSLGGGIGPRRRPFGARIAEALSSPALGRRRLAGSAVGLMAAALLLSRSRAGILFGGLGSLAAIVLCARPPDPAGPGERTMRREESGPTGGRSVVW